MCDQVSGENNSHEREQFDFICKAILVSCIRYKNEIILVPDTVNENEFLFVKKYLSRVAFCSKLFVDS